MKKVSRRSAMKATAAVAVGAAAIGVAAAGDEPNAPRLWSLEGELKVHPKFLYRFFIVLLDGQRCALYGADHGRKPDHLARVQLPSFVRVRGVLGTEHHPGGTEENASPFPKGWIVYMDVHEVDVLKDNQVSAPRPG